MSDDNSHSSDTISNKKGFFSLLLSQLFHGEPKNRDELLALIRDSGQNDLIDEDTRDMLEGVMDIADQRVRDIMIPRSQMITLKRNQTLDECLDVIIESAHSRFPVISEDKDHIEGILMAKDLLPFMRSDAEAFSMDKVLRQAVVVPESKRVDRMLKEFRSQRYHMAIVIDEFGGVSGLVTIEDILELIVGEIEDEYDEEDDIDFPNHLAGGPEDERIPAEVLGRAMVCKKLDMVPVECVARGYLTGSGLIDYKATQQVCGVDLPAGLVESSQLPEPIFTPAAKAELG
ncbi:MAG: CNNM family magnesium/cobalt transport protein CorC, partial [Escherichia coli]|nr:CNNM family magnesium/cobalt transport protein CorC [Escherichia coli]